MSVAQEKPPKHDRRSILIAQIPKSRNDFFAISLKTGKEARHVEIQVMHRFAGGQMPTGKLITLKPDHLEALIDALHKAQQIAITEGLITSLQRLGDHPCALATPISAPIGNPQERKR